MTKPTTIYDSTVDSSPGPLHRIPPGIQYIEVVGAMSSDSIQIQATLDDTGSDWKNITDLVFTEATKKLDVIRGGINIRVVHTGSEELSVVTEKGSA